MAHITISHTIMLSGPACWLMLRVDSRNLALPGAPKLIEVQGMLDGARFPACIVAMAS